ncbi:MAG: ribosomal subunit interface protein [Gammaproteobacteria bacterium RIFCSPHIGHO2_12_FULL_42_13]|nr:MAG: ribosomal subunit interface protein [Gammaproteobacteria bacterium RIFCSPHIGHO2_12_FULL_42_13]
MQLHLVGRSLEITPALKTFTEEKFERLQKRAQNINKINVTLFVEHLDQIAEATVHLHGKEFYAKATANVMYDAIETLVDKLAGQLTKYKEKIIDDHR